jgi:hypothetical protein
VRPNLSALRFVHNFPLISAPVIQVILPRAGVPLGSDIQPVLNGSPTRERRHLEPCRLNVTLPLFAPPDFQNHRSLCVPLGCLCHAERALRDAALRALPGGSLPY